MISALIDRGTQGNHAMVDIAAAEIDQVISRPKRTERWLIVTMDYCVGVDALAASKSAEGRQNGGNIRRSRPASAGH